MDDPGRRRRGRGVALISRSTVPAGSTQLDRWSRGPHPRAAKVQQPHYPSRLPGYMKDDPRVDSLSPAVAASQSACVSSLWAAIKDQRPVQAAEGPNHPGGPMRRPSGPRPGACCAKMATRPAQPSSRSSLSPAIVRALARLAVISEKTGACEYLRTPQVLAALSPRPSSTSGSPRRFLRSYPSPPRRGLPDAQRACSSTPARGRAGWSAAIANVCSPGERARPATSGERFGIARAYACDVLDSATSGERLPRRTTCASGWTRPGPPSDSPVRASTGMRRRRCRVSIVCDAISSLGAIPGTVGCATSWPLHSAKALSLDHRLITEAAWGAHGAGEPSSFFFDWAPVRSRVRRRFSTPGSCRSRRRVTSRSV